MAALRCIKNNRFGAAQMRCAFIALRYALPRLKSRAVRTARPPGRRLLISRVRTRHGRTVVYGNTRYFAINVPFAVSALSRIKIEHHHSATCPTLKRRCIRVIYVDNTWVFSSSRRFQTWRSVGLFSCCVRFKNRTVKPRGRAGSFFFSISTGHTARL